jgi:hypothetical protein
MSDVEFVDEITDQVHVDKLILGQGYLYHIAMFQKFYSAKISGK